MEDRTPGNAADSTPEATSRAARLRAALRANLARRKTQTRDLGAGTASPPAAGTGEDQP